MTEKEFRNKLSQIIIIALKIKNPIIKSVLFKKEIDKLCEKLDFKDSIINDET